MKRWRLVGSILLVSIFIIAALGTWAIRTRTGTLFEKDRYFKQILDNSPFVSQNIGLDGEYIRQCQIIETGTLKGLPIKRTVPAVSILGGDTEDTFVGPCYVEVNVGGRPKIIWGKKLIKKEDCFLHSVHVTLE